MRIYVRRRIILASVLLIAASPVATSQVPEPTGYRMDDYRSAVPASVNGRSALSTAEAADLWRSRTAIFVDTLPQPPKPSGLPAGTIWNPKPRFDIPGSIWLPDTGYGRLPEAMETYFAANLARVTQGDRGRRLVFYCLAHCWMSWNATKHAAALGYTAVDWYAGGTDDWSARDLPLEQRDPEPRPPSR